MYVPISGYLYIRRYEKRIIALTLTGDAMLCIDAMLCMIEAKTTSGIRTYALSTTPENTSRYSAPNHSAIVLMLTIGYIYEYVLRVSTNNRLSVLTYVQITAYRYIR